MVLKTVLSKGNGSSNPPAQSNMLYKSKILGVFAVNRGISEKFLKISKINRYLFTPQALYIISNLDF